MNSRRVYRTVAATSSRLQRKKQHFYRSLLVVGIAGGAVATLSSKKSLAEVPPSKEEYRNLISSQHRQITQSREEPGVYAWGNNSGRVVAPDSTEPVIKTPRRIPYFDGKLLRDIKLDQNFGAAVDQHGDLLQWGAGYSTDNTNPVPTLTGKNIISISLSKDRILALSRSGAVYNLPVSATEQASGPKPHESSWLPLWNPQSPISYKLITPNSLNYSEKVSSIATGLDHILLCTNKGRVFSASTSNTPPTQGQLGVSPLPPTPPYELTTLRSITQIACGDAHNLALAQSGRVYVWGSNASGQLGLEFTSETPIITEPCLLPLQKLYREGPWKATRVAAGGNNSYITVDVETSNRLVADTLAFGQGIHGGLGNNRWTHAQHTPTRIPGLSGLREYDEVRGVTVPIRLAELVVGGTHAAAVLDNITQTMDGGGGRDVLFWGGNGSFQLGTGKRNNVPVPMYLAPLGGDEGGVVNRFHLAPRGREMEQRVHCGRGATCVFSSI
ncbi:RCC1/BLIP-II, partial [Piedraia hortae CBS 480.64]